MGRAGQLTGPRAGQAAWAAWQDGHEAGYAGYIAQIARLGSDMVLCLGSDGRAVHASLCPLKFPHIDEAILLDEAFAGRVHDDERPALLAALARKLPEKGEELEIRLRLPAGQEEGGRGKEGKSEEGRGEDERYCWFSFRLQELGNEGKGGGGRERLILAVGRDIGPAKARELGMRRQIGRLEGEKRAMARCLSGIGHELRTPLNAILGFAAMINSKTVFAANRDKWAEYAAHIESSGRRMASLIDEALDPAWLEDGRYSPRPCHFRLGPVITSAIAMAASGTEGGRAEIRTGQVDEGLTIHADRRLCRQLLAELISLMAGASRKGGRVRISATSNCGRLRFSLIAPEAGNVPELSGLALLLLNRLGGRLEDGTRDGEIAFSLPQAAGGVACPDSRHGAAGHRNLRRAA